MEKKHRNNNSYNPSEDEEFMKIIDEVLKEEEAEKINIRPKDDFEWIDIEKEVALAAEDEDDNPKKYNEVVHKIAEEELCHSERLEREQERERRDDEIVDEITNSLSEQVEEEFKIEEEKDHKKKKKLVFWVVVLLSGFLCLLILAVLFLRFTKTGRKLLFQATSGYIAGNVTYDDGSTITDKEETLPKVTTIPEEVKEPPVKNDENKENEEGVQTARHEDYCINLLLLGEEAIESSGARGRTDLMMIATINSKDQTIGLTSLMRDMCVQIPGHLDNKLNTAYSVGGVPLLYETIALNFNIKLDGYALVGFNNFEKIIDMLSGVTISLTPEEANYLNTTNYISNPNFRNVKAGINQLNGNQALGYCRIRYVGTKGNERDDFGRTSRQRTLLNALFEKYKSLGLFDLAVKVNSCLPMVTTDLDSTEIEDILTMAYEVGLNQIETLRIPADGTYENLKIREMDVIVPDLRKNTELIQDFIFGE